MIQIKKSAHCVTSNRARQTGNPRCLIHDSSRPGGHANDTDDGDYHSDVKASRAGGDA